MKTSGAHINSIVKGQLRKLTLSIAVYYPEHERRTTSPEFAHTRHQMIDVERKVCEICGTPQKLEVHHFYIEWSLTNAVDWEKFKVDYPQFAHYNTIEKFVDSPDNMMILCQDHHRHKDKGIHCMDFPEWRIQKYLKANFKYQ